MNKFDITKLSSSLSGKERAKLLITSWHEAIVGKETFSKADTEALMQFKEWKDGRQCRYYMCLYKHAYFILKNDIEQAFLKIIGLTTMLHQFQRALGIDKLIGIALRAIEGVPTFLSEEEYNKKREAELACRVSSVAYLANCETNALLEQQGYFKGKDKFDFWFAGWETDSTIEEIEKDFGKQWVETFWQQVERIRALVKDGTLQPAALSDQDKKYSDITITGITDAVTTKSWLEFEGKHDKDFKAYMEMEELYAISYDDDEIGQPVDGLPLEPDMRKRASELCWKFMLTSTKFEGNIKKLTINEESKLAEHPQLTLRSLEFHIQSLMTHKSEVEQLEQDLGVSLFDENTQAHIKEIYEQVEKIITAHNDYIEEFVSSDDPYLKTELVDKDRYLLKKIPVNEEDRDTLVKEMKDLAEHETSLTYG